MTTADTEGQGPRNNTIQGYYSDLLMSISILVAIQVAILISLAEQNKLDTNWVLFALIVLFPTVLLLGWSFVQHTFEKEVFGKERANSGKWTRRSYFFITIAVMVLTVIMIGGYLYEFALERKIRLEEIGW